MIAEQEFLAAIAAAPHDTAARLVYADWLEERGDSRSKLIRLRETLSNLSPLDSHYWDAKEEYCERRAETDRAWLATMWYDSTYRPMFTQIPQSRTARWRLIEEFVELWHKPLTRKSGCSADDVKAVEESLEIHLPEALTEWHRLAGKRIAIWSRQDHLYALPELHMDDEHDALVFRAENQGCERWGIRREHLNLDDPPVVELNSSKKSQNSHCTVSILAIQTLLLESMWGPVSASNEGGHSAESEKQLKTRLTRADLPNAYWVIAPVNFYEGREMFLVECEGDGFSYLACRTRGDYDALPDAIRREFANVTFDE